MMMYLRLAWSYIKIGIFGFGGGYAMLTLIEHEIVGNGWLTESGFTDIVAISQMTPGPIGINSATYIGFVVGGGVGGDSLPVLYGIIGSLICTLAVILPSIFLVVAASRYVDAHCSSPIIQGLLGGLRPVVPGLIAAAALLLMNSDNFGSADIDVIKSVAICVAAFALIKWAKIHPIMIIIAAGIAGYLLF